MRFRRNTFSVGILIRSGTKNPTKKGPYTFKKAPWYTGRKNRKRRFLLLCKRAPCSLTSQISLIVVVARTTLIIAIAVVALIVAPIAALIALAQIFELKICL